MKTYTPNEQKWRDAYHPLANLLDNITYEELLTTLESNTDIANITEVTIINAFEDLVTIALEDARFLLELNMDKLIEEVL